MENTGKNSELLAAIQEQFPNSVLSSSESYGLQEIEIHPDNLIPLVSWLKGHEKWSMNFLTDLCGIHYPEQENREIGMVYHLHSLVLNLRLRIKAFMPAADPQISSLTGLFSAANWMERETYDFFGIRFEGHPDLRRILNMDSMDYFPLRKEYALEDETRTDKSDKFFGR